MKREGFDVTHITAEPGSVNDAVATSRIAHLNNIGWIVVDGYQFGGDYQKIIKDYGHFLLVLDDFGHADHYYADIVLNQNIYSDISLYPKHESFTLFLLGTKYVLLRKEFLLWTEYKRIIPDVARKVLVTLGGSDPNNATGIIIEALKCINLNGLEVVIVVGGLNSHSALLQKMVTDYPNFSIRTNVENMPELIVWADIAISAGGTTCWELAFLGLPTILYPIAENQLINSAFLNRAGIAWNIKNNYHSENDLVIAISKCLKSYEGRTRMSEICQKTVDGKGTQRVINTILDNSNFKVKK
jgi:UDP-2,4-diacetamido-2,4,6-trideoxy-beta-L-altropyranose hydrolase